MHEKFHDEEDDLDTKKLEYEEKHVKLVTEQAQLSELQAMLEAERDDFEKQRTEFNNQQEALAVERKEFEVERANCASALGKMKSMGDEVREKIKLVKQLRDGLTTNASEVASEFEKKLEEAGLELIAKDVTIDNSILFLR